MAQLLKDIPKLEAQHKQNPLQEKLIELTEKKLELQTLLNEQTLQIRDRNRTLYYQQGNKPGKLLARALRHRINTSSIVKIKSETGEMVYDLKGILKAFLTFYTRLYDIPNQFANSDPERFQQNIHQYVKETALPPLALTETEQLEQEFSEVQYRK